MVPASGEGFVIPYPIDKEGVGPESNCVQGDTRVGLL